MSPTPRPLRRAKAWTAGVLAAAAVGTGLTGFHLAADRSAGVAAGSATGSSSSSSGSSGSSGLGGFSDRARPESQPSDQGSSGSGGFGGFGGSGSVSQGDGSGPQSSSRGS